MIMMYSHPHLYPYDQHQWYWPDQQFRADQEFEDIRKKNRKAPRPDKITQRRLWREQAALRGR